LIIRASDPDVTIGEAWMFGLMPGSNPLHDVPVYSAFITGVEVESNIPPQWIPSINLAPGFGILCRDTAPYPDSQSAYHSSAGWNITGGAPYDPDGGTWSMWYYISTSPDTQTGSPYGWVQTLDTDYIEVAWTDYQSIAPDKLYLWIRAQDEEGATSDPVKWESDGGYIELCDTIDGWNDDFQDDWTAGGFSALFFLNESLRLYVQPAGLYDSWFYTSTGYHLGDTSTTSAIKVEFSRRPLAWHLNSNELILRLSYPDQSTPSIDLFNWAGSYPAGGPYSASLPMATWGQPVVGSTRTIGWYLADESTDSSGIAYIDYMGIYAHPL